jgi:hypothetical protein
MVVGSLLFARAGKRSLGGMLTGGTFAVGVAYIGFAAAPSLALAALAAVVGGIGNGVQWASLIGTVQQLTPQRLHGRLMGTVESIGALCPLIGLPLSALVLTLGSPRIAFLVFGLAAAGATLGFLRLWMGWRVAIDGPGRAPAPIDGPGRAPTRSGAEDRAMGTPAETLQDHARGTPAESLQDHAPGTPTESLQDRVTGTQAERAPDRARGTGEQIAEDGGPERGDSIRRQEAIAPLPSLEHPGARGGGGL